MRFKLQLEVETERKKKKGKKAVKRPVPIVPLTLIVLLSITCVYCLCMFSDKPWVGIGMFCALCFLIIGTYGLFVSNDKEKALKMILKKFGDFESFFKDC